MNKNNSVFLTYWPGSLERGMLSIQSTLKVHYSSSAHIKYVDFLILNFKCQRYNKINTDLKF